MSKKLTLSQVSERIMTIFQKNKVETPIGEEDFWNSVDEVRKINPKDAGALTKLGNLWDARSREESKESEVEYKGKMVKSIDMTPTWESLLPWFFIVLEGDNEEGKKNIKSEITRMARALDKHNAEVKQEQIDRALKLALKLRKNLDNESGKTKTGKL